MVEWLQSNDKKYYRVANNVTILVGCSWLSVPGSNPDWVMDISVCLYTSLVAVAFYTSLAFPIHSFPVQSKNSRSFAVNMTILKEGENPL